MTQTVTTDTPVSEVLPRFVYGWLFFLGILGVGIIYAVTSKYGPALSYDTGAYVLFARNIMEGRGFVDTLGRPVALWAPGYSAVVALGMMITGQETLVVMRGLAALAYGVTVFSSGYYLFRWVGHRSPFAWLGSLLITLSAANQNAFVWALSEPQFIAATLIMLIGIERYLATGRRLWWGVAMAAVWLATLTRYIGLTTLVPMCVLALLLWERGTLVQRLRSAIFFGVAAVLPLVLWLIRNYLTTGSITGSRPNTVAPLLQHIFVAFRNIALWFAPVDPFHRVKQLLVGGLTFGIIGLLTLVACRLIWQRRRSFSAFNDIAIRPMMLLWLFVIIYLGILLALAIPTRLSNLEDRLLIPIFAPLMVLIFGMSHLVWTGFPHIPARRAMQGGVILIMLWLVGFNLVVGGRAAQDKLVGGAGGYNSSVWQENGLVQYLKNSFPADRVIYSNDNSAVYLFSNQTAEYLPTRIDRNYGSTDGTWLKGHWPSQDSYMVWFTNVGPRSGLVTDEEVLAQVESTPLFTSEDGAVYGVRKSP